MKNNVPNIVLLGHMGSGKSTIGKGLAKRLSIDFIDTDYEIEKFTDTKISNIFLNQGESRFREIEENIIKQILDSKEKKVIALGGGSFENKNIRALLKGRYISIWLKCNIDILVERLKKNKNRPLLIGKNIKSEIIKIDKVRKINYESADFHYDVSKKQKKIILKEIVQYIKSIVWKIRD